MANTDYVSQLRQRLSTPSKKKEETSTESSFVQDLRQKAGQTGGSYANINDDYLNSFVDRTRSYFEDANNAYDGNDTNSGWRNHSKLSERRSQLIREGENIRSYYHANKGNIDSKNYRQMIDYIDSFGRDSQSAIDTIAQNMKSKEAFMGQFASDEDYERYEMGWLSGGDDSEESKAKRSDYYTRQLAKLAGMKEEIRKVNPYQKKEMQKQIDELQMEINQYERTQKVTDDYGRLAGNADFERMSSNRNQNEGYSARTSSLFSSVPDKLGVYLSGQKGGGTAFDYADDYGSARTVLDVMQEGEKSYWSELSDKDVDIYYYILNTQGQEQAYKYLDDMGAELGRRHMSKTNDLYDESTALEKIALNVATIPANILGGIPAIAQDVADTITGKGINPYGSAHSLMNYAQTVRGKTTEEIKEATGNIALPYVGTDMGDVYNAVMSGIDSLAGVATFGAGYTYVMGSNAAVSEARKLYEQGASGAQIAFGSLTAGVAEAFFEKFSIDNFLNPNKRNGLIKNILIQAGIEASEEMFTEIANTISNTIVMGSQSDWMKLYDEQGAKAFHDKFMEILNAGIGGALSGGLMAGLGGSVQATQNFFNNYKSGSAISAEGGTEMLMDYAKNNPMSKQGTKVASKVESAQGKSNPGVRDFANIGKLAQEVEYQNRENATKAEIKARLESEGIEVDDNLVNKVYKYVTSDAEAKIASKEVRDIAKKVQTDDFQKAVDLRAIAQGLTSRTDYLKRKSDARMADEYKEKVSESGEAEVAGKAVDLGTIASISDGEMVINTTDGKVNESEVKFASTDEAHLYASIKKMGVSAETGNYIINAFKSSDLRATDFVRNANLAYQYGLTNQKARLANLMIPNAVAEQLFKEGRSASAKADANAMAEIKARKGAQAKRSGDITFVNDIDESKLDAKRKATVEGARFIASATQADIYVYESVRENGKTYINIDGKKMESSANGWFVSGTNKIYIDINAGADYSGVGLYTLAHESGHYIREWNAEGFRKLADIIVAEIDNNADVSFELQMQKKLDMYKDLRKRGNKDYQFNNAKLEDMAYEDVVCDSLASLMTDAETFQMFANKVKKQDKSLWNKLKEAIGKFLKKLDKMLSAYKETSPDDYAGQYIKDLTDARDTIREAYVNAFLGADTNYKNASIAEVVSAEADHTDTFSVVERLNPNKLADISDEIDLKEGAVQVGDITFRSHVDPSGHWQYYVKDSEGIIGTASDTENMSRSIIDAYDDYISKKAYKRLMESIEGAKTEDGGNLFQHRAMEHDIPEYVSMLRKFGANESEITHLFGMVDKAIAKIKENLEILDYDYELDIDDRPFKPVKPNSDSLYKYSVDFSTLCRKRIMQQIVQIELQAALDRAITREESIAIRNELMKIQEEGREIEVACALCYVESARMKSPAQIQKFLDDKRNIIKEFFANKDKGNTAKNKAQAEIDERERLAEEYKTEIASGKIPNPAEYTTAKNGNRKYTPLKVLPGFMKEKIRQAKKSVVEEYKPTTEEAELLDVADALTTSDFTTPNGLANLAKNYPRVFDAYTSYVRNATKSKGIEKDTWWRAGDSYEKMTDDLIDAMNKENGLRSQSWSDFQVIHTLDYIAAIIELSTRGAKMQAYTKVPDYVKLMGLTNQMINLSLIPTAQFDGKLSYDSVEGMDFNKALELRDKYPDTAGTICIGISDEQIKMLLESEQIDYVIPYHQSGMSKVLRKAMHIPTWISYESSQNETALKGAEAEANAKRFGATLLSETDENWHKKPDFSEWFDIAEARRIAKEYQKASLTEAGKALKAKYGKMFGSYMAMKAMADNYLKICAERGLNPKFAYPKADFSSDQNYWKLLIDRKMINNKTGELIEQKAVKPIFKEEDVLEILDDEVARYPKVKADQEYATRTVVEKFLTGKMASEIATINKITGAVQTAVDNVTKVSILESADEVKDTAKKMSERGELDEKQKKNFDFNQGQTETGSALKTLAGTKISRYKGIVGKEVSGCIYLNRMYASDIVPQSIIDRAEEVLREYGLNPDDFKCAMWNKASNTYRFDEAPDFDTAREPIPGRQVTVSIDNGNVTSDSYSSAIWHHKWLWVENDYTGFDVRESWEWSKKYLSTIRPVLPSDYSFRNNKASDADYLRRGSFSQRGIADAGNWNEQLEYFGLDSKTKYSLRAVDPVVPTSNLWTRGHSEQWFIENGYPLYQDTLTQEEKEALSKGKKKGHGTQVSNTLNTYKQLYDKIKAENPSTWQEMRILDASSGLGLGTAEGRRLGFDVTDIEPFAGEGYTPRYSDYSELQDLVQNGAIEPFDFIISNAVLNVIPQDTRDNLVSAMKSLLADGGQMFVNVIDKGYLGAVNSSVEQKYDAKGRPTGAVRTQEGDYTTSGKVSGIGHETFVHGSNSVQKVFSYNELVAYLQDALGDGYTVVPYKKFGMVAAWITKDGTPNAKHSERENAIYGQNRYSERILMGSVFSGGGTLEAGLTYQMLDKEFAVEFNKQIATVYTDNHGKEHMFVGDIRDFDSKSKRNVFYLHASPVCKSYSPANHSGGEKSIDITTAEASARVLEEQMPEVFTVENVKRYIGSEAYNIITKKLDELGYTWDVDVYKAADYGNATKRERMIIRAVKSGELPAKPAKVSKHTSWYEATKDLFTTDLVPSTLVKSKIEAIKNTPGISISEIMKSDKPIMIYDTTKSKKITYAWGDDLAPTLTTKCGDARIIWNGQVYAPTPKFMGRIQGLPDDYKYPKSSTVAFRIIGNGIPTQLTSAVIGGVLDSAYEQTHEGSKLYSERDNDEARYYINKLDEMVTDLELEEYFVDAEYRWTDMRSYIFDANSFAKDMKKALDMGVISKEDYRELIHIADRLVSLDEEVREYSPDYAPSYAPTFYSKMTSVISGIKSDKVGAAGVIPYLKGKGVKDEEIKWSGIEAFLDGKKSVTKAELAEFAKANMLQIDEETLVSDAEAESDAFMQKVLDIYDFSMDECEMFFDYDGNFSGYYFENAIDEHLEKGDITQEEAYALYSMGAEFTSTNSSADGTKWHEYKTSGGTNYREIIFEMPDSDYSNRAMEVHWGREGVVAHARIQDMTTADGQEMLFVDEIQSDWHNAGQKDGYVSDMPFESTSQIKEEIIADERLAKVINKVLKSGKQRFGSKANIEWARKRVADIFELYSSKKVVLNILSNEADVFEFSEKEEELILSYEKRMSDADTSNKTPDAPFKNGRYIEFVMKRLLRMAAEGSYDSIGWTTGNMQEERWSDHYAEGYRIEYDQDIPKFMKKYGKQWGATVSQEELKNGKTVWSVSITPEMRESVLYEGQSLFSERQEEAKESNESKLVTDREESLDPRVLLSGALETTAQNEIEQKYIDEYRSKIDNINKLQAELDTIRAELKKLSFAKGKRDTERIKKLSAEATKIANRINTYDKKLLRLMSATPLKRVVEREKALAVKRVKQQTRENLEIRKNRLNDSVLRKNIKGIANDLYKMVHNPTERKFIPTKFVNSVIDIINSIDGTGRTYYVPGTDSVDVSATRAGYDDESKAAEKYRTVRDALNELKRQYDELGKSDNYDFQSEFDEEFSSHIAELADAVGDTPLREMTTDQLEDIFDIMSDIKFMLEYATKQILKGEAISNYEAGQELISNMRYVKAKGLTTGQVGSLIRNWTENPMRATREMAGFDPDSRLVKLFEGLNEGRRKADEFRMRSTKKFDALRTTKADEARFNDAVEKATVPATDVNGKEVKISKMQALQALLTYERENANPNRKHLDSPVRFTNLEYDVKGKYQEAFDRGYDIVVDEGFIAEIKESLTEWDRRFLDVARQFFNVDSKNAVNEVSLQTKHRLTATEKAYIPYYVNQDYIAKESENIKFDARIEGMGMLKSVVNNAPQQLVMRGLSQVIDDHIGKVAKVYGLTIPVRNINKVINMKQTRKDGGSSVKSEIRSTWGDGGLNLIDRAIADVQSPRIADRTKALTAIKNAFVTSTLAGNLSVVIKQAASYPTAGAVVSGNALTKSFSKFAEYIASPAKMRATFAEIDEHTPQSWIRRQGLSTQELGDINQSHGWQNKLNKKLGAASPMNWIQYVDVLTTTVLWDACKAEVESKGIAKNSDGYWDSVTNLYNKAVEDTQPMYDALHRAEVTKKSDIGNFIMFQTQPLQNSGILREGAMEYRAYKKRYGNTHSKTLEAKRRYMSAVESQLLSHFTFTALTLASSLMLHKMNAYRDDDKDLTAGSVTTEFMMQFLKNVFSAVVPIVGNYAVALAEKLFGKNKYDILSDPTVDKLNGTLDKFAKLSDPTFKDFGSLAMDIASYFGVPAQNVYNIINGAVMHIEDAINGQPLSFEAGVERTKKQTVGVMYHDFLGNGTVNATGVEKANVTSYCKPLFLEAYNRGDNEEMANIRKFMNATRLYDNVVDTTQTWIKNSKK